MQTPVYSGQKCWFERCPD